MGVNMKCENWHSDPPPPGGLNGVATLVLTRQSPCDCMIKALVHYTSILSESHCHTKRRRGTATMYNDWDHRGPFDWPLRDLLPWHCPLVRSQVSSIKQIDMRCQVYPQDNIIHNYWSSRKETIGLISSVCPSGFAWATLVLTASAYMVNIIKS